MKEINCQIVDIHPVRKTRSGDVQPITIKESSLGKLYDVGVFLNKKEFHFNKNDEVMMKIQSKEWQGKTSYSASLDNINPIIKEKIPERVPIKVPQNIWDEKDRRMVKMNACNHATELIKFYLEHFCPDSKNLTESEITNLMLDQAEIIENWVYES